MSDTRAAPDYRAPYPPHGPGYSDLTAQERAARTSAYARREALHRRRQRIVRDLDRNGPTLAAALELVFVPRWCSRATLYRDLREMVNQGALERVPPFGAYGAVRSTR